MTGHFTRNTVVSFHSNPLFICIPVGHTVIFYVICPVRTFSKQPKTCFFSFVRFPSIYGGFPLVHKLLFSEVDPIRRKFRAKGSHLFDGHDLVTTVKTICLVCPAFLGSTIHAEGLRTLCEGLSVNTGLQHINFEGWVSSPLNALGTHPSKQFNGE